MPTSLYLALDPAAARTVARRAGQAAARPPARWREGWVALDTAEGALARAGWRLLLVRRGRAWSHRLAALPPASAASAAPPAGSPAGSPYEWPAPGGRLALGALPDRTRARALDRVLAGAPLVADPEVAVQIGRWDLPGGVTLTIAAVGRDAAATVTATLTPAGQAALDHAQALIPQAGARLGAAPPEALTRRTGGAPVRTARAVPLRPGQTAESAAAAVIREAAAQIRANVLAVQGGAASEGPHQLRVGLRRLRAALGLFRAAIGSPEVRRIGDEARWLGAEVGRLRDLDVIVEDVLMPEAAAHPDEPGFVRLADALRARCQVTRADLCRTLAGDRTQAFLVDLARLTETRAWLVGDDHGQTAALAAPLSRVGAAALDRRWRKVRRMARELAGMDVESRHALRKELKKLRYGAEFLGIIYPKAQVSAFVGRLKALQEVFGSLNDAATAQSMLTGPAAPLAADPDAARASGLVIGGRLARADQDWTRARALWRDLDRARPFWR